MELNLEEIEKADFKEVGTYDLIHYIQGSHMELIDDGSGKYVETCVFDCVHEANDRLIAEVKRLREERDSFQSAEKEISDAYLRIREIVGAWDTNMGGENRYEVTENAVRTLKEENISLNEYIEQLEYDLSTIPKFLRRSVREKALKTYRDMRLGKENEDERE